MSENHDAKNKMCLHDGKLFVSKGGLFSGDVPVAGIPERPPQMRWTGTKIPWGIYCQIVSFFRAVYKKRQAEAIVQLLYSTGKHEWRVIVMPQRVTAGSASEIEDHPERKLIFKEAELGEFNQCASIHSHASMPAFQSGGDSNDELKNFPDGFHLTIGKFDNGCLEFDARVILNGFQYSKVLINNWIDSPNVVDRTIVEGFPDELLTIVAQYIFSHPPSIPYPPEWDERIIEPLPITYNNGYDNGKHGGRNEPFFPCGAGGGGSDGTAGSKTEVDSSEDEIEVGMDESTVFDEFFDMVQEMFFDGRFSSKQHFMSVIAHELRHRQIINPETKPVYGLVSSETKQKDETGEEV